MLNTNLIMFIDLHTHSYFSDGEYSPRKIIIEALDKNVSIISITDHNFISETRLTKIYAKKCNIKFIEGIEISTLLKLSDLTASLHILGYGKSLDRCLLNNNLAKTINGYNHRAGVIINKLNREFPRLKLNLESLMTKDQEAYVSRNTLAKLLVTHLKNSISIKDALKQYVFVKEDNSWMMTPEECFELIISAGGVPILAHSGKELRKMGLSNYEKMISWLVKHGLMGLEVYYPKHTAKEINIIKNIANKFNLCITGGSDWHGKTYTPDVEIGLEISTNEITRFLMTEELM